MNKRKLIKELNKLCQEMSENYNINNGGCCFVAACLAEQLEKYNISYKVFRCTFPTHYCIKIKDEYINRDGFTFNKHDEIIISADDLYFKYKNTSWNWQYNKKWNLIVKTRIKSVFKRNENRRERFLYGTFGRD